MSTLIAARTAQCPLVAEFVFNFDDTMLDVNGVSKDFKTASARVFDIINLPDNAVITGGSVTTETAVTGSTAYNVKVGDVDDDDRYLTSTDKVSAGTTALVPTGYVGTGQNLRLTVTPTVADATAGKLSVRVEYVIRGRYSFTQTS